MGEPDVLDTRAILGDALRFWEWRRIPYNAVLAAIVVAWIVLTWPHFRPAMTLVALGQLFGLALIANMLYCAAYLVDFPAQCSAFGPTWRRGRWALWLAGTLFAFVLANYWIADEIYPFV